MPVTVDVEELERVGRAAGLDAVGVAAATPFTDTRRVLELRRDEGLHGGMAFTYRNPERSTDPARTVSGAASLVVGARAYAHHPPPRPDGPPTGRVAAYAWHDHYAALRAGLDAVAGLLRSRGHRATVVVDDNALVDRAAAYRAGLGWYGKNANVLLPGQGSWFVLGSVITTAALPESRATQPDGCGPCQRCIDSCPTHAIVAPGVVDARRCLAWLVQAPGDFPLEFREALGDRLYGCDDCQEVCPPNRRSRRADDDVDATNAYVPLLELLDADDATLLDRHRQWYIPERDPRWLRRNALVCLGNSGAGDDPRVAEAIGRFVDGEDEVLRSHAQWAADRLGIPAAR